MIFLDSNIISYYFSDIGNVKRNLHQSIMGDAIICTTILNVYEIVKGFRWKNNKRRETEFVDFIKNVVVISFDDKVVDIAASIYASLRKKGITIGDSDILIAAIVIANNGTLVTSNTKHFENIEQLKVENWV